MWLKDIKNCDSRIVDAERQERRKEGMVKV